jgi:chromosomal replication initiation ATPase DnaA
VQIEPEVITFLVCHMERSFAAAGVLAAALDLAALSRHGPITIPLAKRILAARTSHALPPESAAGVT